MPTVTEHFGIQGPVAFVDVSIEADNRLYLDPGAMRIARHPQPHLEEARSRLDSLFNTVTGCVLSKDKLDRDFGRSILQRFNEPWETRLGMSALGFRGHGGSSDVGTKIWDCLSTDCRALLEVGVLKRLEHMPMYVEGLDNDITSDLITRTIFDVLAGFTANMLERHPELGRENRVAVERHFWSSESTRWESRLFELPLAGGEPLLLVPGDWVSRNLIMNAGRFYETTLLTRAQDERAVVLPSGRAYAPPKRILRIDPTLKRGRHTNIEVTLRSFDDGVNLVVEFEEFVKDRFEAKAA